MGLTRMPGATMLRIQPIGEGTFQLVRKNDDLIIQRAVETPLAEPHVPQQLTIRRAFDLHGRESLEVPVGPVGSLFSIDDPATARNLPSCRCRRPSMAWRGRCNSRNSRSSRPSRALSSCRRMRL